MDMIICNKCFSPIHRGKQPYNITNCAHIFCQGCLQQAEKQCPQCGQNGAVSIPLKEPLVPKVSPYFAPIADTLELLQKVDVFRSNQIKITVQRFREIDRKYEVLKTQYFTLERNMKSLMGKYVNLKSEKEKLDKRLMFSEIQRRTPRSTPTMIKTTADSGIFTHPSNTRYSAESLEFLHSIDAMSVRTVDPKKQHRTDGFRIPTNYKPLKPVNSFTTPDMSANYSFMR